MTIATALTLRAPLPNERTALADMWVESWRATFPEIDFRARVPWLMEHLARLEADGAKTICAFDAGDRCDRRSPLPLAGRGRGWGTTISQDSAPPHPTGEIGSADFCRPPPQGGRESARLLGFVTIDPAKHWLDQLSVHPAAFGAGVAKALLEEAKRLSPQKIGLDVNADNFRARKFYEREGFVTTGEGVNPLSERETCVLEWRA